MWVPSLYLFTLAYCISRMGRRCFQRMILSARWAGSGKMKNGPQTSIGLLMSKVGTQRLGCQPGHLLAVSVRPLKAPGSCLAFIGLLHLGTS